MRRKGSVGRRTSVFHWIISWGLVLLWTNPSTNADGTPLMDFAGIRLEATRESDGLTLISDMPAAVLDVDGTVHTRSRAGDPDSCEATVPLRKGRDDWWLFWVSAYDSTGNYGGRSNEVRVSLSAGPGPVTGVEGGALPPGTVEWYDVHGRRVDGPGPSGVYFRRKGKKTDTVIVVK